MHQRGRTDCYGMGDVVPVFDLALHFGYAEQESNYLVAANVDDVKITLEVSSSDKALWVEREMVKLLPAIVKTAQSCFREVLVYEERLIGLLAISSLSL